MGGVLSESIPVFLGVIGDGRGCYWSILCKRGRFVRPEVVFIHGSVSRGVPAGIPGSGILRAAGYRNAGTVASRP